MNYPLKSVRFFRRTSPLIAVLAAALMFASPARAQTPFMDTDDDWSFSVTPYLFLPVSTTGTSTVAGGTAPVDLNLRDVFKALNFAAAGRAEAWKGDFGVMVDLYYTNLSGGSTFTGPRGRVGGKVDITAKQGWVSVLGGYRFLDGVIDDGTGPRGYAMEVGAGVRYNNLRQTVDASLGTNIGPGPGIQTSLGGTEVWWEPVVMLRGAFQLNDRWMLGARAEFGGFGVGGDNLQWLVLAGADYRAWENTSVRFGWQFYGIDFSTNRADGKFAYDVFQTGPYMGMTFRF